MAKTKFLIFPKKLFCSEPPRSPPPHLIWWQLHLSNCSAKNLACLGPECLSVSQTPNSITSKYVISTLRIHPESGHFFLRPLLPLWIKPLSSLYYCSGFLIGAPPPAFIPLQACLEIEAREILLKCRIWFDPSYILPQAPCIPDPRHSCCSPFIPKHAHLMALASAVPLSGMRLPRVAT